MRLVYSDPLEELKALIAEAKKNPQVGHIAITTGELRACLNHAKAAEVFPELMNKREKELNQVRARMQKLKPMLNGNTLSDQEKQPLFDQMDTLELREEEIKSHVPSAIQEGGVLVKVSMR